VINKSLLKAMWFTAMIILIAGCANEGKEIAGQGPVEYFKKYKHWLYVYAKSNSYNIDLYNESKFGLFRPGHTIPEALSLYGEPQSRIPEKTGAKYIVYRNDFGVIKLGSEGSADGDIAYPMYFIPDDRRLSSFFCPAIVAQIDESASRQVVMIFDHGYKQPHIHAIIEFGQIKEIILINKDHIE
jgi:hypothetical protein